MTYLHWSSDLETGLESIDGQHRHIVGLINQLNRALVAHELNQLNLILDELIDYKLFHFKFEEALLLQADYPFSQAHKKEHELLIRQSRVIQQRAMNGKNFSQESLYKLKTWLVNHIRGHDADYVACVMQSMQHTEKTASPAGGWLGGALEKLLR